jgi:hypothetical protein
MTCRRAASVWTIDPVSVRVDDEVRAAQTMQKKIVVWRPLKIVQDALHGRQMELPRVVHVQTDLLHDVGDVGPCECQVLESSCNAPELRGVLNGRPRVPANFVWRSTGVMHGLQSVMTACLMMSSV